MKSPSSNQTVKSPKSHTDLSNVQGNKHAVLPDNYSQNSSSITTSIRFSFIFERLFESNSYSFLWCTCHVIYVINKNAAKPCAVARRFVDNTQLTQVFLIKLKCLN